MILFTAKYARYSAYTHPHTHFFFLSLSLSHTPPHAQRNECACLLKRLFDDNEFFPSCVDHKNPTHFPYTQICLPFRQEDGTRNPTWRNPLLSEKAPPRYPIISAYSNMHTHAQTHTLPLTRIYI